MKSLLKHIALIITVLLCFANAIAQNRNVTPVENDEKKPPQPSLHFYDKHGEPLEEPVLFLADLDTVKTATSGPVYPAFNGVDVGVNFADLLLKMTGQKYAGYDVWAAVSLYNWFFPVIEAGIGSGSLHPGEDNNYNFTYVTHPSLYLKIGFNYNFLYKSTPDYQVLLGFRAAWSRFTYDVTDVRINVPYWNQTNLFNMESQNATALYGELVAGIKVKIVSRFSLGWTGRYHFRFHVSDSSGSTPWYIPGYGASSPFSLTLSAIWSF